ncbi:Sodium-dependent phosphate transport protein 1 [Aphelenchoides fujianensis]|nr:Sodium-dependent phosphate transport protein 1 [Aphelenchoides fujianensis]
MPPAAANPDETKRAPADAHELILGAFPDRENPVVLMDAENVRRLSLTANQRDFEQDGGADGKLEAGGFFFAHRTRFIVLILSTACLTLVMANSLALNFTVICMFKDVEANGMSSANGTNGGVDRTLMFNDAERSWLFSGIAVGTILGTLPISYLNNRFGLRRTFTFYGLTSAISTFLIPLGARWGFGFVFFLRIVEGFAVATSFPAMGSIATEWATLKRSGTFVAYLSTHLQLGTILTMPVAGELCESSLGWEALYYIFGAATALLFAAFYVFYRDSPAMHRNVSNKELSKLQKDKVIRVLEKGERPNIPYRAIFTDWSVLGIIASCIGGSLGFQLFFQYGPLYLNKVLKFNVQSTGFAAAVPPLLSMILKFIAGPLSDNVPYLSDKWRVIMFASISQFAMAACFAVLAFLPDNSPVWAQVFYTLSIVFSGLNCVGVSKSVQLISGRFSYILMAVSQFVMSVSILYLPLVVTVFAPDNTPQEWARLFVFTAVLVFVTTMMFNVTAEATPRPWAYEGPPTGPNSPQPTAKSTLASLHDGRPPSTRKVAPNEDLAAPDRFDLDLAQIGNLKHVERVLNEKRLSIISGSGSLRNTRRDSELSVPPYPPPPPPKFTETVKLENVDL